MRDEDGDSNRPVPMGFASWNAYWTSHGMPWRTEPDIDEERQAYLTGRRAVTPDIERGIYPFRDEHGSIQLSRADVEWLLATHESGGMRGPVDWQVERQRDREGLDLRGADLRGLDLRGLPLARLRAGLPRRLDAVLAESEDLTLFQQRAAAAHFEGTNLTEAHFEGAVLDGVHFEEALARRTQFTAASLSEAHCEWMNLHAAHLQAAQLQRTRLEGASLNEAHLEGANLASAHLENALLNFAHLEGANLRGAFLSSGTDVEGVHLTNAEDGAVSVVDVRWGSVNLAAMRWRTVRALGDEQVARQGGRRNVNAHDANKNINNDANNDGNQERKGRRGRRTSVERSARVTALELAVRANRQVATVLREQGVNEDADRFAYRAQLLQRQVLRRQRQWVHALGSWLLDAVSGYGYKPLRSVFTYLLVILSFAAAYFALTNYALMPFLPSHSSPLAWYEALVLSVSSFHGRGLFPTGLSLGDPVAILAAIEAVIGLLIEIVFIATFTQRLFAR